MATEIISPIELRGMEAVEVCYKREYKHIPTNTSSEPLKTLAVILGIRDCVSRTYRRYGTSSIGKYILLQLGRVPQIRTGRYDVSLA